MNQDFWLERWEKGEIGFHQGEFNPHLLQHWRDLSAVPGSKVFVPLCGKTRDMLWLRQRGHSVFGIELSTIAVETFFQENGFTPTLSSSQNFKHYTADDIQLLRGDFFDLTKNDLKDVHAVYDRASLVALPPEMRQQYASHLADVLPKRAKVLLITFDYQQREMPGPPFAVSRGEVEALFRDRAQIRLLAQYDVLAENPRFQQRGLSRLHESVFSLEMD